LKSRKEGYRGQQCGQAECLRFFVRVVAIVLQQTPAGKTTKE
jgi:hypothetical protein